MVKKEDILSKSQERFIDPFHHIFEKTGRISFSLYSCIHNLLH